MILYAQNLHTFSKCRSATLQMLRTFKLDVIFLFAHMKLVLCSPVFLALFRALSRLFLVTLLLVSVSLND